MSPSNVNPCACLAQPLCLISHLVFPKKPNNQMKKFLTSLCLLAMAAVSFAAEKFPDISHDELKAAIAEKQVTIIDVNGTERYKQGHIPGAQDFYASDKLELPKDKNALIVAYCGNEKCSAYQKAANKAKKEGYTNVKHYSKGIAGWEAAKEQTEK